MPKEFCLCEHLQFLYAFSLQNSIGSDYVLVWCSAAAAAVADHGLGLCELKLIADFHHDSVLFLSFACLLSVALIVVLQVKPWTAYIYIIAHYKITFSLLCVSMFLFLYNMLLIDRRTMVTIKCLKDFRFFLSLDFRSWFLGRCMPILCFMPFFVCTQMPTPMTTTTHRINLCFACCLHLPRRSFLRSFAAGISLL